MTHSAVAVALLLAALPLHMVSAEGPEPVKIRVETTDNGFNDNPGDFVIEVEQGHMVELTFVWAHKGYLEEEHLMVLEGYNLESEEINFYNRESTIKFIADKPGSFTFKCDLDCEVHDYLQKGHLKVTRGGGGGTALYTPTALALSPSFWVTGGDPVTLMAVLNDTKGVPVPKVDVTFTLDTDFAGTQGQMEIGRARTDVNGVAFLDYRPSVDTRKHVITARFPGTGIYEGSEQAIEITEVGVPPAAYTAAPIGLERVRGWAPVVLIATILGVWTTLGFVVVQALRIARVRARR